MQVHVIHDPLRKDRHALLMKEKEEHSLDLKIWDAVKGLPRARMNISAAHKKIVQWAKETNQTEIIIAEDDFHLTGKNAFQYFLQNKPEIYHLYLGGISWGQVSKFNVTKSFSGLFFYMIHHSFYDSFLLSNPSTDIDRAVAGKGRFIVSNPFIAITHKTWSDHRKKFELPEKYYKNRPLYVGS